VTCRGRSRIFWSMLLARLVDLAFKTRPVAHLKELAIHYAMHGKLCLES